MSDQVDDIDFAIAAFQVDSQWEVQEIAPRFLDDLSTVVAGLRRLPGEAGALGMIAVDEDFFVLVRVRGASVRALLSDVTAAEEWELARSVLDHLRLPPPEEDDEPAPAGDIEILADLGLPARELAVLLDEDDDLYPDEMLSDIAGRLGFGPIFDDAVGIAAD